MKKLLGTTLALAMFVPAGANAELLKNFKMGGQLDIQTTSARNVADFATRPVVGGAVNNDRIGNALTRLMLKLDWDLLDDVHAHMTLVKGAGNYSKAGVLNTNRTYGSAPETVQNIQDNTIVQEANVKIDKVFGAIDMTMGRMFVGTPGDPILYFGPRDDYGLSVTALDAFLASWSNEHMNVVGVAGKVTDGAATVTGNSITTDNAATDVHGVIVSCTKMEAVKPTAYLFNVLTHATGGLGSATGKNTNLFVAGLKAKLAMGGAYGSVEFAKNFGEDRTTYANNAPGATSVNYKGYMFQAKAGYKADIANVAMINPWGEFGMGTGDSNFDHAGNNTFQAVANGYRPGAIYGRFYSPSAIAMGSAVTVANGNNAAYGGAGGGLSNRVIWGFGVKATPAALNKLTAGAQFYRYAFHSVAPNAAGSKTSRNIGSEVDVTGEWKHSENVGLKLTAGTFQPGAYINDLKRTGTATQNGTNPATMLAADVTVKF